MMRNFRILSKARKKANKNPNTNPVNISAKQSLILQFYTFSTLQLTKNFHHINLHDNVMRWMGHKWTPLSELKKDSEFIDAQITQ